MSASTHLSERAPERPRLDDPLLDRYIEFVESRARYNTLLATASDLRAFFAVVSKPVPEVTTGRHGLLAAVRFPCDCARLQPRNHLSQDEVAQGELSGRQY